MAVAPGTPPTPTPILASGIVTSALREIGVLSAFDTPYAEDMAWGLEKLQRLIDQINAIRQAIYAVNFEVFTTTPNLTVHTIGPNFATDLAQPNFSTGSNPRPVRIVSASFILNPNQQANQVDAPRIRIQSEQWWAGQPNKQLTSSIITDLYYSPQVPFGYLHFWPICNAASPVRLEFWTSLVVPLTPNQQLYYAQGYWNFVILTLALTLCPSYERSASPELVAMQNEAQRIVMANNAKPPLIRTDNSMPQPNGGWGRPDFDFLTGLNDN